jgi:L-asparaginase
MTMAITAKYLGEKKLKKTIVLIGSLIPAKKNNSDALFNLGTAFAAVELLPHGVYITMHGEIFNYDNAQKNLKTGLIQKKKK